MKLFKMTRTKKRILKEVKQYALLIGAFTGIILVILSVLFAPSDYDVCVSNGKDANICAELLDNQ